MKKIILSAFISVVFLMQIGAQNEATLTINHRLGIDDFEFNQTSKNNLDHDFRVTRLEYYISEISLVHDGGNETAIEDLWILVGSKDITEVNLGAFDIDHVEKIKFYIGVDPDHNHLDPATFPQDHPLAPKFPSMHWGWTPGYRFVAYEGMGGADMDQVFQLHGLGDVNYLMTEIDLDVTAADNKLLIGLDADYSRALEDIELNTGVIVHGETLQAKKCIENFRDFVFSPAEIVSSTIDFSEVLSFNAFPNPVENGTATIQLNLEKNVFDYNLSLTSIDGRELQYMNAISDGQEINLSNYAAGMYLIHLIKEGQTIITNKVIIK